MNRCKQQIPEGLQDYLPEECYNKILLEDNLRHFFFLRGYNQIDTPIFEFYDVFLDDNASISQDLMFKVVDTGNRILVIRPDFTTPIARIMATRMGDAPLPLRISYSGSVHRHERSHTVNQREIPQAGIELIGVDGPEADAEIIAIAIEVLLESGLKNFKIDIGQVDYFKGLIENTSLDSEEVETLRLFIEDKNPLGLDEFLKGTPMDSSLRNTLLELPSLYGGIEVLDRGYENATNDRCRKAIDNIQEVYEILKDYGLEDYLSLDLGMIHSLNYYTGITFRGVSHGLGFPICGGGRYNELLSQFGTPMPATGFAMGIKRLLVALEYQKSLKSIPPIDVLVVCEKNHRGEAYDLARQLREDGRRVEIFLGSGSCPKEYARERNISKIIHMGKEGEVNVNHGFA